MIGRTLGLLGKLAVLGAAYYAVSNGALALFAANPGGWLHLLIIGLGFLIVATFLIQLLRPHPGTYIAASGAIARAATKDELRTEDESRPRRARHEAGHAVAAVCLGMERVRADVRVVGDRGGNVSYQYPLTGRLVDTEYSLIMIALAGQVLDLAAGHHDVGARGDIGQVTESALTIVSACEHPCAYRGPLTLDALVSQARADVERLLGDQAEAVDRVTTALLQRDALDAEELLQLVRPEAPRGAGHGSGAAPGMGS
ncbi:hypothetical protein [Microbacterium xylanilyticum]